jgi:hypothetical protein
VPRHYTAFLTQYLINENMADADTPKKIPYGFIIYRGDYKDDAKWERFMAYLKQETRRNLESDGTPEQWNRMDWKVIVNTPSAY